MINNLEIIKPLLIFDSKDDFYFLQILQRKKDHKKGNIAGTNNNSRMIKYYCIESIHNLELLWEEIVSLCNTFGARACISLNKKSHSKAALQTIRKITDQMLSGDYNKVKKAHSHVCGSFSEGEKKWIIDIDEQPTRSHNEMLKFIENKCRPIGNKFIASIPSKNGYHMIVSPFELNLFKMQYPNIDVHKENPTNLYIP